jgi:uncharacterized protein YndB with AHSA1/START domain
MTSTPNADFELTLTFTSSADAVFDAIVSPECISGWWVPAAGSGIEGSELRLTMGSDLVVLRVDQAERPQTVTWSPLVCPPAPDWVGTTISFDIEPTASGGAQLNFRHVGLAVLECFDMCRKGWGHHLGRLVDFVDHGVGKASGSTVDARVA